mgnify:CR=1 FL=1
MIRPLEINFYKLKNNQLQESFLAMFGETIKVILKRMFGKIPSPEEYTKMVAEAEENEGDDVLTPEDKQQPGQQKEPTEKFELIVSGTDDDISSFLGALKAEHKYMDTYLKLGMDEEETREAKYLLSDAVEGFERTTGLLWPFV